MRSPAGPAARAQVEGMLFARLMQEQPVTDMRRSDCRGCGECCGRWIPLTIADRVRLEGYVRTHGIEPHSLPPQVADLVCPYLDLESRECMVYEARPEVCRHYSCRLHASGGLRPWRGLASSEAVDMRELADSIAEGKARAAAAAGERGTE